MVIIHPQTIHAVRLSFSLEPMGLGFTKQLYFPQLMVHFQIQGIRTWTCLPNAMGVFAHLLWNSTPNHGGIVSAWGEIHEL